MIILSPADAFLQREIERTYMETTGKRYVLNTATKIAHIRPTLEECNVDQLEEKHRELSDTIPEGFTLCEHCQHRYE